MRFSIRSFLGRWRQSMRTAGTGGQLPRYRSLSLERLESRVLLAAPVLIASHTYSDGVMVSVYDSDPDNGISDPDIAWSLSDYEYGVSDILCNEGRPGDGILQSVYMYGDGSDTQDIGIVVEDNESLGTFGDNRTEAAPPMGFVVSEGSAWRNLFKRGIAGGELNGWVTAGGLALRGDLDYDGDTTDLTGFYCAENVMDLILYSGGAQSDLVVDGHMSMLMSWNEISGDIYVGEDLGWLNVQNTGEIATSGLVTVMGDLRLFRTGGDVLADVTVVGHLGNLNSTGEFAGNLTVGEDAPILQFFNFPGTFCLSGDVAVAGKVQSIGIGGETTGFIDVEGDLSSIRAVGQFGGGLNVGGDLARATFSWKGGIAVSSDLTVAGDAGWVVFDGDAVSNVDIGGNLGCLAIWGDFNGSLTVGGHMDSLVCFGEFSGNINVTEYMRVLRVVNRPETAINGNVNVGGHVNLFFAFGDINGDVNIGAGLYSMVVAGQTWNGNLHVTGDAGSVSIGGDIIGTIETVAGGGAEGNIGQLQSVQGRIVGGVNVAGDLGVMKVFGYTGMEPNVIVGNVTVGGLLRSFYVSGGDFNGQLRAGAMDNVFYHTTNGLIGNLTTTGGGGTDGHLRNLSVRGNIPANVSVVGQMGVFFGLGDLTGNVDVQEGVDYFTLYGSMTGNLNVPTGDVMRVIIGELDGGTVDVATGGLGTLYVGDMDGSTVNVGNGLNSVVVGDMEGSTIDVAAGNLGQAGMSRMVSSTVNVANGDIRSIGMWYAHDATISAGGAGTVGSVSISRDWIDSTVTAWHIGRMTIGADANDFNTYNVRNDVIRSLDPAWNFCVYRHGKCHRPYSFMNGCDIMAG